MTNRMYTSLELSKKLKEAGCELESRIGWFVYYDKILRKPRLSEIGNMNRDSICLAYDIANDILIRYAKEFFGEKKIDFENLFDYEDLFYYSGNYEYDGISDKAYIYHSHKILEMLQQNKPQEENEKSQEEIEKYIWANTIFNKEKKQ